MISLIQSMFDKNTGTKADASLPLQANNRPSEELKIAPSISNNHGIEVEELSFEDVARIMGGK
ncbi:MAG: hypothetical protein ACAH07_08875 [Methylophilaceae bacterium]|nr:hypothetical protein [Methyloradius sp.]